MSTVSDPEVLKIMTIREVALLIGTLVSTFPGVQFGPLHYRTLERDKNLALRFRLEILTGT